MSASNLYLIRIRLIVALFLTRPLSSELHLDATILLNLFFRGSLDQGQSLSQISAELALDYDVLRKAVADGRLKRPLKKKTRAQIESGARS